MKFKDVTNIEYFSKGRRGCIYTGIYKGIKVAVKARNPESRAIGRIENEAKWIEKLNRKAIGPNLLYHCPDYLIYRFIEGVFIEEYIKSCTRKDTVDILRDIIKQCFIMDTIGINKEEMHRPVKHILIENKKPVMLDFERTRNTEKPKNVTQFIQFITWSGIADILKSKGINLDKEKFRKFSISYKKDISRKNFANIMSLIV